jgi:hypothetical protein
MGDKRPNEDRAPPLMSPTLARAPCGTLKDINASAKYARRREVE